MFRGQAAFSGNVAIFDLNDSPNGATRAYGEWDPAYLRDAAQALDEWFVRVRALSKALLKSQDNHKSGKMTGQKTA